MMALEIEHAGADLRRWVFSGTAMLLAHAGIAAALLNWRQPPEMLDLAGAIVIEFAPVPVAPATPVPEIAPGPEQVMSDASPANPVESREETDEEKTEQEVEARLERIIEENESRPVDEPPPDVAPAPNPEVVLAPAPQQRQEQEDKQHSSQRLEPRAPAPTTSAPQVEPEAIAALPAAPEQGPLTKNSRSIQSWQRQVVTLLERNKRYPPAARSRRQQGVAQLFFTLDRHGHVTESRVLRSSGATTLDQEALALLHRAQPFPPPPPELTGERVGVTVPIRFNLK
jgi:protein TonB